MSDTLTSPAHRTAAGTTGRSNGRWPLTGVAAGLLGIAATLALDLHPANGPALAGRDIVDDISRGKAQAGLAVGYLVVAALLVLAAQWRRFVEPRVTGSTAARVVSGALTAAAGALALGYGFKGMLAVYLPGGLNGETGGFDREGLYVMYVMNDFGAYIGWVGVTIAAGAIAWMAFRERTVSRWIGAVSLVPVLAVTAFAALTGLPGFPGVVSPLWMVVTFTGLAFGRSTISR